jgi:V8-like Glu-specific endopeptidase
MTTSGLAFIVPGLVGLLFLGAIAVGAIPGISRTSHTLTKDDRVVKDRLHARNNRNHEDYSFLNAVGAVWPDEIQKSAAGYSASTGFLIDRCHVLTNMHVVYTDDTVINPPVGNSVAFAVGQTEGEGNRGALQGLRFLLNGVVIAHGDTIIVDHFVHNPESDWALIRLADNVDGSIAPMTIAAVETAQLPKDLQLSIAGFPADRRDLRSDRFSLKDLWGSDGRVVEVLWASTAAAVVESTIQATRGDSGGPLYGDFNGRKHIVIGILQGIRGNGIDVSEATPNIQVLFTPGTLASIRAAQARTPCQ